MTTSHFTVSSDATGSAPVDGRALKALREHAGLKQDEVAGRRRAIGWRVSPSDVSYLENAHYGLRLASERAATALAAVPGLARDELPQPAAS